MRWYRNGADQGNAHARFPFPGQDDHNNGPEDEYVRNLELVCRVHSVNTLFSKFASVARH